MLSEQELEYLARRAAVEALLAGELPDQLRPLLDLGPEGQCFALARFAVPAGLDRLRDALVGHFLKYPAYILLSWGVREYLVILKAEPEDMDRCISRCLQALRENVEHFPMADWHAAVTPPVACAADLPGCYENLSRLWAFRYLLPGTHLLTRETVGQREDEEARLLALDPAAADPRQLRELLEQGSEDQLPEAVARFLAPMDDCIRSDLFCRYLAMSTRFTAAQFVAERGCDPQAFVRDCRLEVCGEGRMTAQTLTDYMLRALRGAIRCREGERLRHCRGVLRRAAGYVDSHFREAGLSLEQVAAAVDLSPNYLSALFRREMDCTFVEFVTARRMELARELLETTALRTGQIAEAVGYRDPRYFSSLFRRTQGMTPREYRGSRRQERPA